MTRSDTAITRFAVLGQLALRDWSAYELTRSMARTLRWFWPRAESGIYAEARRLEAAGWVTSRPEPAADGSRRTRTVYSITDTGRRSLRTWLATPARTVQFHLEPFLRLHLARSGTLDDLRRAVEDAEVAADELLRTAVVVAEEFVAGTHLFQDDVAFRGLLFDGLWAQGVALKSWATESRRELDEFRTVEGNGRLRARALARMKTALESAEDHGIRVADAASTTRER